MKGPFLGNIVILFKCGCKVDIHLTYFGDSTKCYIPHYCSMIPCKSHTNVKIPECEKFFEMLVLHVGDDQIKRSLFSKDGYQINFEINFESFSKIGVNV